MDGKVPYEIVEFYGRGFKCYRWIDKEGNHVGPLYFSTPEKAQEWKDKQNATN